METIDFNQVLTDNISVVEGLLHTFATSDVFNNGSLNDIKGMFITNVRGENPNVLNAPEDQPGLFCQICVPDDRYNTYRLQIYYSSSNHLYTRLYTSSWYRWNELSVENK